MKRETLQSMLLALIPSMATALLVQACSSSDDAVAQTSVAQASDADPVEGVWDSIITLRNCATGAAIATVRGQNMFHRGGTLTDTNAQPPTARGVGFGLWKRDGAGPGYTATFRFNRYNLDGTLAGSRRVTRTLTLSVDGNTQTSTNASQDLDPAGAVLQDLCATDVSTRVL